MAGCDSNVCAIINTMVHVRYDADIVVYRCCSVYYIVEIAIERKQ